MIRTNLIICLFAIAALATFGCQGSSVSFFGGEENQETGDHSGDDGDNDGAGDHNHGDHDHDELGHGPDPDAEVLDFNPITGSWRISRADDDTPVAYLDVFLYENETTGDGNFVQALAPAEMLDGARGDIEGVRRNGDRFFFEWNPTAQLDELYTVEFSASDTAVDQFTGQFSARQADFSFEVTVRRMIFDDEEN